MILTAALVEENLTRSLLRLMPGIKTRQEHKQLFEAEAPLQGFSAKIKIAKAIGVIDVSLAKKMDIIRSIRNAAAHAPSPMTYDCIEVRNGVALLFGQARADEVSQWSRVLMRVVHSAVCAEIGQYLLHKRPMDDFNIVFSMGQDAHIEAST